MELIPDNWEEEPPGGWAPDPPDLEQTIARLQSGEPMDALEALDLLAALIGSDEELDAFAAWVRRERRANPA